VVRGAPYAAAIHLLVRFVSAFRRSGYGDWCEPFCGISGEFGRRMCWIARGLGLFFEHEHEHEHEHDGARGQKKGSGTNSLTARRVLRTIGS
jgi:hypothetical protein